MQERLISRIAIVKEGDETAQAYLYNREAFNITFESPVEKYDKSQFLKEGTKVNIDGKQYEIVRFQIKLSESLSDVFGTENEEVSRETDYNCQITVFIK